jgi:GalNAc-alpha-(1->4)-GalNAc-alpha-(1->3)-diNAcBac-PP-undecaprenol alpha-1,4-N-acetyl-D-galactosaminyltransferase
MRVTFVISSLGLGGAERTMSIMANYWAAKGWAITLICLDGALVPFYDLAPGVRHVPLGVTRDSPRALDAVANNIARIAALRRAIVASQADVVISFMHTVNVLTLVATRFLRIPVIVSEHMPPWVPLSEYAACNALRSFLWNKLRSLTHPFTSLLVVLTADARSYYSAAMQSRTKVIPNCVQYVAEEPVALPHGATRPLVIAMGRLARQKGFDHLLTAFSRLGDRFPEWSLAILGEGPLRGDLEQMVARLGIADRVHLLGAVRNPYAYLSAADLFVMSSRYEAFPNALLEAMAAGLPAISYQCCEGVREIIRDGVDGLLVAPGDVEGLVAAMERVMGDGAQRGRMASRALEVRDRFSPDKVMRMWEEAIDSIHPVAAS